MHMTSKKEGDTVKMRVEIRTRTKAEAKV